MKRMILLIILFSSLFSANADDNIPFRMLFDEVVDQRLDEAFFHDCPYDPALYDRTNSNARMWAAIDAMSNRVDEAVSLLPDIVTNAVRREVFLNMAGHAGTNAFLCVWEGLLDIAETNASVVTPQEVHLFQFGASSPLENYPTVFYTNQLVQQLLSRTKDLFPTNSENRAWYDATISGTTRTRLLIYVEESGECLPPCMW